MEVFFVIVVLVIGFVIVKAASGSRDFDDPKPMSNEHLLSAIAGQADWLDKMIRAPFETQQTASIVAIAQKRRGYIARLCLEVVSRGQAEGSVFNDAAMKAKELEASGISAEKAAVQVVRKDLFAASGATYIASWEN